MECGLLIVWLCFCLWNIFCEIFIVILYVSHFGSKYVYGFIEKYYIHNTKIYVYSWNVIVWGGTCNRDPNETNNTSFSKHIKINVIHHFMKFSTILNTLYDIILSIMLLLVWTQCGINVFITKWWYTSVYAYNVY